ncbi:hypothetical protein SAMN05660284_00644 [Formivibrio citricus]|uniref:DUF2325 domain-containing protein n=1 Tax=Formivibrio citricus TaxID=83765 RepID=A0A1I4WIQ0_9NEIS|nr:DUF2325 domain-containing protein [Formivibrio citricus]SFN13661.1 hypothetical protein SAMN05660284_00644 [Formivibrio citricus]
MSAPSRLKPVIAQFAQSGILSPGHSLPAPHEAAGHATPVRLRLWELAEKYHCPVIGTCIPMPELAKLAKRFGLAAALHDEFALHVEAVGQARIRNDFSEALQRYLDKKYQLQIERFSRLKTDAEVLEQWKASLESGEVAGALWAALTHKASSVDTRHCAYADIHMLSHQVGAGQVADARRLARLETENAELMQAVQQEKDVTRQQMAALRQRNAELETRLAELEAAQELHEANRQRLVDYESGQAVSALCKEVLELKKRNQRLFAAEQRLWSLEKTQAASHAAAQKLATERNAALAERDELEQLLHAFLGKQAPPGCSRQATEECGACEHALSERCILYVGGRTSMQAQYRQLADRLGIHLIHHDGGMEESLSRLPEMIRGADVVVCPTDHISHSAYYQVKNHCKRIGKPCLFYRGTGMGSFAAAIGRVARGDFSLPIEAEEKQ